MYSYRYSDTHNETKTLNHWGTMLKEEIEITSEKINWFYRLRDFWQDLSNTPLEKQPSDAEYIAMYRKHSDLFGIAGRGRITMKDLK